VKQVKRLLLPIALLLLTAAAHSDDNQPNDQPIVVGFEYRDPFLSGQYFDRILSLRFDFDLQERETSRVDLTFPFPSRGADSFDDVWRVGISALPLVWRYGEKRLMGEEPMRPEKLYGVLHYLTARTSAKLFVTNPTFAEHSIDFELERFEIWRSKHLSAIARGGTRSDMPDWGIGLTYQIDNLQFGLFTGDPILYVSFQKEISNLSP